MSLIDQLSWRLQRHPKRVVFPEGGDPRILQAARQFATRKLGVPILLGDRKQIKENAAALHIRLDGIRLLQPTHSDAYETFLKKLPLLPGFEDYTPAQIEATVRDVNYFATLMLTHGQADALVSGATVSDSSAHRPLMRLVPRQEGVATPASLLVLDMDYPKLGSDGVLCMADCGVNVEPTAEQLADIAVTTGSIAFHLTNARPKVALLSYSSKSTNNDHPTILKIKEATQLAQSKAAEGSVDMDIDGELQVDTALVEQTAHYKHIEGPVAGQANVLVFPDLNSGNIASKLLRLVAEARAYGSILTGLTRPCAEISRGASAHDIFGAAVLVACQAVDHRLLYGKAPATT